MNLHQDDYLLKTSSKSCLQASHFALIKFLFAYYKQPKQIFLLKMELSLDPFFAFFKQFNFYGAQDGIRWLLSLQSCFSLLYLKLCSLKLKIVSQISDEISV